jgi:hypothetical protein
MGAKEDRRRTPRGLPWVAALLVAACGSQPPAPVERRAPTPTAAASPPAAAPVPGIPGTAPAQATPPAHAASAPVGAPPPTPSVSAAAATSPAGAPPSLAPSPPAAAVVPPDATVPAAIAARFPEPAVTFATPAFEAGRRAFTSNAELRSIVRGLERRPGASGGEVGVLEAGVSQAGEPILALVFRRPPAEPAPAPAPAASGAASPMVAPAGRRPAVVIVAGQHGDEPAGTEALLVVAQDFASGRHERILERVDVVLLPRANPDGAERFQRGAADGTDIERDHLLLHTPEAQAQARLMVEFAPLVVLDLHEYPVGGAFVQKFGALQRFDVLLQAASVANLPPFVGKAAEEWFRQPLVTGLGNVGMSADWYATTSADLADRKLSMGGVGAQIGRNAAGLRHSVSLLLATRGGGMGRTDLKRRVQAQVLSVHSVLGHAASRGADLAKLRQFVDRETAARACTGEAILEAAPTPSEYMLSVLDPQSGAIRRISVNWDSALALRIVKSRPRPCGYWIAAGQGDALRRLQLLGIEVSQLDETGEVRGESYREIARQPVGGDGESTGAVHAGGPTRIVLQTVPALLELHAGGYYVSLEQPLGDLAVAVLEPESPASFSANRVIEGTAAIARVLQRPTMRMTGLPVR